VNIVKNFHGKINQKRNHDVILKFWRLKNVGKFIISIIHILWDFKEL